MMMLMMRCLKFTDVYYLIIFVCSDSRHQYHIGLLRYLQTIIAIIKDLNFVSCQISLIAANGEVSLKYLNN